MTIKKTILFVFTFLGCAIMYSQTNTSLNSSTTRYQPTNDSYYDKLGSQAEISAQIRATTIFEASNSLRSNAEAYLDDVKDEEFKTELKTILNYLEVLKNNNTMSLKTAEWYFKTAEKKLKKSVKAYNKRLKKFKGEAPDISVNTEGLALN